MFLLVSVRHVGAHLGEHQHGVSIQISIVGFHMTSEKLKLKNYRSYRDFTFTMH